MCPKGQRTGLMFVAASNAVVAHQRYPPAVIVNSSDELELINSGWFDPSLKGESILGRKMVYHFICVAREIELDLGVLAIEVDGTWTKLRRGLGGGSGGGEGARAEGGKYVGIGMPIICVLLKNSVWS